MNAFEVAEEIEIQIDKLDKKSKFCLQMTVRFMEDQDPGYLYASWMLVDYLSDDHGKYVIDVLLSEEKDYDEVDRKLIAEHIDSIYSEILEEYYN